MQGQRFYTIAEFEEYQKFMQKQYENQWAMFEAREAALKAELQAMHSELVAGNSKLEQSQNELRVVDTEAFRVEEIIKLHRDGLTHQMNVLTVQTQAAVEERDKGLGMDAPSAHS